MSLAPMPSPAELLAIRERRLRERGIALVSSEPRETTRRPAVPAIGCAPDDYVVHGVVTIGDPPIAIREGDRLTLTLNVPPRTKKNSTRSGQPRVSVKRFAHQVKRAVEPHAAALGLPLPARWYNCAALFTVDNDAADTVGLMQGLADALEGAGVLVNDRWIRRWDGTDQTTDPVRPGVVLVLSPID